jgi:hypothetical protein
LNLDLREVVHKSSWCRFTREHSYLLQRGSHLVVVFDASATLRARRVYGSINMQSTSVTWEKSLDTFRDSLSLVSRWRLCAQGAWSSNMQSTSVIWENLLDLFHDIFHATDTYAVRCDVRWNRNIQMMVCQQLYSSCIRVFSRCIRLSIHDPFWRYFLCISSFLKGIPFRWWGLLSYPKSTQKPLVLWQRTRTWHSKRLRSSSTFVHLEPKVHSIGCFKMQRLERRDIHYLVMYSDSESIW